MQKAHIKLWRHAAVIGVAVILTAACSSGSDTDTDSSSSAGATANPDATFRFADTLPIDTLDPHKSPGAGNNVWLFPVYDRLIHLNPSAELVPGLATEWSFSDDGRTLSLTLRENVTFHDGTPFDAAAVQANIDRAKTVEGSAVASELAVIDSVEVVDDAHVDLKLNAVNSALPYILTDRAGAIASPAAFDADLARNPVGTGMYRVTEYQPSSSATYERNPDYWDPDAAAAARMEFTSITDSQQRLNALRTNSIDATILDAANVAAAESAGLVVDSAPVLQFYHLQLNLSAEYLDDVRVRQAINHAVNRADLVSGLLFDLGEPAVQPFPSGYFAHDESVADRYPYDPQRARELLDEAGVPEGHTLEFINQNAPAYTQLTEALQAQLLEVGLDVEITQTVNFANSFYVEGQGDAGAINWTGRPDPSQTVGLVYAEQGFANPGKVTTPEVTALYQELLATTDETQRQELARQLSAQITTDALDVVLYFPYSNVAYSDKVVGLENWLSGKLEFPGVGVAD